MSSLRRFGVWFKDDVAAQVVAGLIVVGILALIAITLGGGGDNNDQNPSQLQSGISSPGAGQKVPNPFTAEGTLADLPRGHHVWLATEVPGGLFPKPPEITAIGPWEVQVSEAASRFSLVLLRADPAANDKIRRWFLQGQATGAFPALTLPSAERLDIVRDLVPEG